MQVKRGEKLKGAPFRFSLFRPSILVAPSTQARMITQYPKIQEFLGAVFCASVCGACCWAGAEPNLNPNKDRNHPFMYPWGFPP